MMQCKTCGANLADGVASCSVCGAAVDSEPTDAMSASAYRTREEWIEERSVAAGIQVGYSKVYDTPEFQAALKQGNKTNTISALLAPLVLGVIAGAIAGFAFGNLGAAIGVGVFILVVGYVIAIYLLVKRNASKTWDGEVVDIYSRTSDEHGDSYYIVCRTDAGKKHTIQDNPRHSLYDLLQVGDRVRFHPRLNLPLEKYDKSHDEFLVCSFCGARFPVDSVECEHCKKPLLR